MRASRFRSALMTDTPGALSENGNGRKDGVLSRTQSDNKGRQWLGWRLSVTEEGEKDWSLTSDYSTK